MSRYTGPTDINPEETSGEDLANDILDDWMTAERTGHSGNGVPSYALAGMPFVDTSSVPWKVCIFDGDIQVVIGELTPSAQGVPGSFNPYLNIAPVSKGGTGVSTLNALFNALGLAGAATMPADFYAKVNQASQGYLWMKRSSVGPVSIFTQQNTGPIIDFNSGPGDGTRRLRIAIDGSMVFSAGANQVLLRNQSSKAILQQTTSRGGLVFGCDDTLIMGSGESHTVIKNNVPNLEDEQTYIGSDNNVIIYTNLQSSWDNRHEFRFDDDGNLYLPERLNCRFAEMDFIYGANENNIRVNQSGFIELRTAAADFELGGSDTRSRGLGTGPSAIYPLVDGLMDCGLSSRRFDDVRAINGVTSASDFDQKRDIAAPTELELAVARKISPVFFRWKTAYEIKGEFARYHMGVIAQQVEEAFASEGLNASDYGMYTMDYLTDADGTLNGKTMKGIRYQELQMFIMAAMMVDLGYGQ